MITVELHGTTIAADANSCFSELNDPIMAATIAMQVISKEILKQLDDKPRRTYTVYTIVTATENDE